MHGPWYPPTKRQVSIRLRPRGRRKRVHRRRRGGVPSRFNPPPTPWSEETPPHLVEEVGIEVVSIRLRPRGRRKRDRPAGCDRAACQFQSASDPVVGGNSMIFE